MQPGLRARLGLGPSLEDLAVRAASGDRDAFNMMIDVTRPGLRRYIARRVPSSDVEDVLQDCLIGAWKSLPAFEHRSGVKAWMFAIADYRIQNYFRSQRRGVPTVGIDNFADSLEAPDGDFQRLQDGQTVNALVQSLSEDQMEIVRLYYGSGLTLQEIARRTSRNLNTVKYHFYQAHRVMANAIPSSSSELDRA